MTTTTAATLIALAAAGGLLLDTVEIVRGRHTLGQFFPWPTLFKRRRWVRALGRRGDLLFGPVFLCLVVGHAVAAVAAAAALAGALPGAAVLTAFVLAMRIAVRARFPHSQTGADQMQLILWAALTLFALVGPRGQQAVLVFIAAQSILAYVTAGLSKLAKPIWRDGSAVRRVLASSAFGSTMLLPPVLDRLSPAATWSTLVLEIGGPALLLLGPEGAVVFCGAALLFHLGIALSMGLTPFLFAFGATHPALVWLATTL